MGVHVRPGTMPGAVTPICNTCGVALCWDVAEDQYEQEREFWDAWICRDCNGGLPMRRSGSRPPLVLIVCGGRDFEDSRMVWDALDRLKARQGIAKIKHGGCRTGADAIAQRWAEENGVEVEVFDADWERHGKAAGPVRNQAMADSGADGCVAFPGGRGTADMMRRAEAAGIKVWKPFG